MAIREDAIKYDLKKEEGSIIKADVEVDPSVRDYILDKTFKYLVQRVSVPGFRKGKAPRPILEKYLGNDFYSEAIRLTAREVFNYIVEKEKIKPYGNPYFDLPSEWKENEKINLSFSVEVVPEIKVGDYKGFSIEKNEINVSKEEVDKVIEQLKFQHSKLKSVEDREAIEGDIVYVERETRDGEKLEPLWIRLNGSYNPEIEKELIGLKVGEQKIIETSFPEDYPNKEFAGKVIPVNWRIKKIWTYETIDDEALAEKLGFSSVDDLYKEVFQMLTQSKENEERERNFQIIIDKILENSEIDPPLSLVLALTQTALQDIFDDLRRQGKTFEEYLEEIKQTEEEFISHLKESTKRRLQIEFVLDYIAEKENIQVSEEELDKVLEEMAKRENKDDKILRRELERNNQLETLRKRVLKDKVIEFLIEENIKKGEE